MTHEEWLCHRRSGIGGSDAAAIAGVSRWKDPFSVYMDKTDKGQPFETNEALYWGSTLENVVISEFMKRSGLRVEPLPVILQHPEVPYLLANLDGIVIDDEGHVGVFEAKTANAFSKCEWEGDKVPDAYMLQVQHYLNVTGYDYAYIAVLIGGNEFQYKRIQRDNEMIQHLMALEMHFWTNHVLAKSPPVPTAQSTELLALLYPGGKKETLILPADSLDLIKAFETHQASEKEAKNLKDEAAAKIKALMGDHETAAIDGHCTIKWTPVSSERFDTTAFKKKHPILAQEYTKASISRRFTVKSK
ncbi:lambda-exonuclease family protein [Anoxynatronum sibiricum]|uniref:YqaJ viral recombinase family nuclease n=1 Tax=Anoxynatronum sibiricum TaxID=210623 RepID=UPI0031B7FCEF